jgi:hypothetical protein
MKDRAEYERRAHYIMDAAWGLTPTWVRIADALQFAVQEAMEECIRVGDKSVHLPRIPAGDGGCDGCADGWCQSAVDAACEIRNQYTAAIRAAMEKLKP